MNIFQITTESGSIYEMDEAGKLVRRHSDDTLRGDGEWLRLATPPRTIIPGHGMRLLLEPLAEGATYTLRMTAPVVSIVQVPQAVQ